MKTKTQIALGLDSIERGKELLDESCKKILSYKSILAFIIQQCVDEFKEYDVAYIAEHCIEGEPEISAVPVHRDEKVSSDPGMVSGINSEDSSIDEGIARFDILVKVIVPDTDNIIVLYINVEAQANTDKLPYPVEKRGIYYCCREISRQYGREFINSHYEKIKKVYSIWICFSPPAGKKNTVVKYSIEKNDVFGITEEKRENYDLINVVMINIGDEECECKVLSMLQTLFSKTIPMETKKKRLDDEYHIPMTKKVEEEVDYMCNYSDYMLRVGREEGIEKGIEKGRDSVIEGMRKVGISEEQIKAVLSFVPKEEKPTIPVQ